MKTSAINSSSSSYSFEKFHHHGRNHHSNYIKLYKGGFIIPPILLWCIGLISIFGFFLLYSPSPNNNNLSLSSQQHQQQQQNHHHQQQQKQLSSRTRRPPINSHSGDDKCDLSKGKWVPDLNRSQYTTTSCVTIPDSKNCFKHGRIDSDFLNWKWKPNDCELPKFNPYNFLQIVSGKNLAFVGDSVARNHMESLLCLLSQVETPENVYKDSEDRFRTWHFPSSNFTVMMFWSKFLVNSEEIMVNNSGTGIFNLHFDKVDESWSSKLSTLDYVIMSDAHWFFRKNYLYDQGKSLGCVYCNEPNVTELGLNYALRMSFRAALKHINNCKDCKESLLTIVRTFSPAHFENGQWNTGGGCNRTSPHKEEKAKELVKSFEFELRNVQMEELDRAIKENEGQGKKFRALDVTLPMLMRPDGHPSQFWGNKWMKGYNDCVHWCMPGPVDAWSDFLLAVLQKEVA